MAILLRKPDQNVEVEAIADTNGFLMVTEAYARGQENVRYSFKNASGVVFQSKARLWGIFVNTSTSGSITIKDGTTNAGSNVITIDNLVAGRNDCFYGVIFDSGIFVSLTSCTVTIFYEPLVSHSQQS